MRLGGLVFRPRLLPTLAFLLVFPILLSLGRWQLGRAAEKEEILASHAAARQAPATELADVSTDWASLQYHDVLVRGELIADRQFLLDNRVHQLRVGFEVLTPMRLDDGRAVLVNRGWLPLGQSREDLPDVRLDGERETRKLRGVFAQPSKAFALGAATSGYQGGWPAVIQYYDFVALSRMAGVELIPGVVYLDEDQPGLYTHVWKPLPEGPEKHYSYALQWFCMAAAVLFLYITLNTRRSNREETPSE